MKLSSLLTILTNSLILSTALAVDTIVIKGSDSMIILNQELASSYAQLNSGIKFDVEGRGSETGIQALLNGITDIAASSRPIRYEELAEFKKRNGVAPREVIIALDGSDSM